MKGKNEALLKQQISKMKREKLVHTSLEITLNVNGHNSPIKRHRLVKWIKNKVQEFVVCKKYTSLAKTHII
jgi:hypothetical protein